MKEMREDVEVKKGRALKIAQVTTLTNRMGIFPFLLSLKSLV